MASSFVDLCAAMRAAGVSSVWLSVQRTPLTRAVIYQVCSDLPIGFRAESPIFDRITGYDHIDGLTRYTVSIRGVVMSSVRVDAGSGLWPIGTIGSRVVVSSSSTNTLTFSAMWSARPLDIQTFTTPREGARPVPFYTDTQYGELTNTLNSCRSELAAVRAALAQYNTDMSLALGLTPTQDQKSLVDRAARVLALSMRAGRVIFVRPVKTLLVGRY